MEVEGDFFREVGMMDLKDKMVVVGWVDSDVPGEEGFKVRLAADEFF